MTAIGGVIALDLREHHDTGYREDEQDVTRKLQQLVYAPAGCEVVIHVAANQMTNYQGLDYLCRHGAHLGSVTVHASDAPTVARWVNALRSGTFV